MFPLSFSFHFLSFQIILNINPQLLNLNQLSLLILGLFYFSWDSLRFLIFFLFQRLLSNVMSYIIPICIFMLVDLLLQMAYHNFISVSIKESRGWFFILLELIPFYHLIFMRIILRCFILIVTFKHCQLIVNLLPKFRQTVYSFIFIHSCLW